MAPGAAAGAPGHGRQRGLPGRQERAGALGAACEAGEEHGAIGRSTGRSAWRTRVLLLSRCLVTRRSRNKSMAAAGPHGRLASLVSGACELRAAASSTGRRAAASRAPIATLLPAPSPLCSPPSTRPRPPPPTSSCAPPAPAAIHPLPPPRPSQPSWVRRSGRWPPPSSRSPRRQPDNASAQPSAAATPGLSAFRGVPARVRHAARPFPAPPRSQVHLAHSLHAPAPSPRQPAANRGPHC
jgi:protein TonB